MKNFKCWSLIKFLSNMINLSLVFLLLSCSSAVKNSESKNFTEGVRLPEHQVIELSNGLKVMFLKDSSLPRIDLMALVSSGAIRDPKDKTGLSYLTASLLDEGTQKHSSSEIAERLESQGANLSIQPGYDFTHLSISGLSYTRDFLLDSLIEVLVQPKFDEKEISRLKKQIQGRLTKIEDDPDSYADRLFSKILYQNHPYAHPSMGEVSTLDPITSKDIKEFFKNNFTPKNTMVAIVGDFDDHFIQNVKLKFSTWLSDSKSLSPISAAPLPTKAGTFFKNKKGLNQAQIRMGHQFIHRAHPDFLSLRLANMALGGSFTSRLNQVIRDDLGLTYGASSSMEARYFSGPFVIETFTRNNKVREVLDAALKVYKGFSEKGLTEVELKNAKSMLIGQFPRAIETNDSLAFQMLALQYYGIPETYLTQFIKNVDSITLEQVNSAIKKYYQPEKLQIVILGEGSEIEPSLKKWGVVQKL